MISAEFIQDKNVRLTIKALQDGQINSLNIDNMEIKRVLDSIKDLTNGDSSGILTTERIKDKEIRRVIDDLILEVGE